MNLFSKYIIAGLLVVSGYFVKAQSFYIDQPDSLKKYAINFRGNVRMDFFNNFSGGIDQGGGYLGEADFGLNFETEKAGLWKHGELFIQGMTTHGKKPSANVVGDLQTFSNIESEAHTALYEFWYNHHFFDDKLAIIFGQLDMNADFSVSDNAMKFINSSFGVIPTLSLNNHISIFPLLTLGGAIKFKFWKRFAFQTAIYNGSPGDFTSNPNAVNWKFSTEYGYYSISEFHFFNKKDTITTGTYKIGVFYHSAQYQNIENGDTLKGNYGFYFLADHMFISNSYTYENGLSGFLTGSLFPDDRNILNMTIAGGICYHGPFKKRKNDDFGIAFAFANFSNKYTKLNPDTLLNNETAIELMYRCHLTENIMIQPEIQYIINPGATKLLKNSLVGLLRIHINI